MGLSHSVFVHNSTVGKMLSPGCVKITYFLLKETVDVNMTKVSLQDDTNSVGKMAHPMTCCHPLSLTLN
jgi:hypothetical protein